MVGSGLDSIVGSIVGCSVGESLAVGMIVEA